MSAFGLVGTSTNNDINQHFRGRNRQLALQLIALIEEFEDYWPMTVRAFYYQAVAQLLVSNSINEYRRISRMLATLRREGIVPWESVEDKTRSTSDKRGLPDVSQYIETDLQQFLQPEYYGRCYIQDQANYVELSVEKDALSTLVKDAAWMFCARVNVLRGQSSATLINNMAERFGAAIMRGKNPVLLHFGDLDPTGVQIPKSAQSVMLKHHGIEVDVRYMGLTPEQCDLHGLPQSIDAAKPDDPNIRRWYAAYGDQSPTELDALHPRELKKLVAASLESVYDMSEVDAQKEREASERDLLRKMRRKTLTFLREAFPEHMKGIRA